MPSDARWRQLVALLEPAAAPFAAALADAAAAAAEQLAAGEGTPEPAAAALATLGPFGAAHMELERFGARFEAATRLAGPAIQAVRRARSVLDDLQARGPDLWTCRVPAGAGLAETVQRRLAEIGRAFGAARVVRAARTGGDLEADLGALVAHRFQHWSRTERLTVPPLLIGVAGDDLRPAALADVLDGQVRLLLVVDGPCPVAPLARLITPGTYVQQATDPEAFAGFAGWAGPGIAALVPEGSATFVHDPRTGLTITAAPAPRAPVAGVSLAQQRDALALLERLARPAAQPVAEDGVEQGAADAADPAGRLAAWLIARAGLGEEA